MISLFKNTTTHRATNVTPHQYLKDSRARKPKINTLADLPLWSCLRDIPIQVGTVSEPVGTLSQQSSTDYKNTVLLSSPKPRPAAALSPAWDLEMSPAIPQLTDVFSAVYNSVRSFGTRLLCGYKRCHKGISEADLCLSPLQDAVSDNVTDIQASAAHERGPSSTLYDENFWCFHCNAVVCFLISSLSVWVLLSHFIFFWSHNCPL